MAQPLPNPQQARVLLSDPEVAPAELERHGDQFLAASRPNLAVTFYERAKSAAGLRKIKDWALKEGDEFLLSAVARSSPDLVDTHEWHICAETALRGGKLAFARDAFRKAGDEEKALKVQEQYLQTLGA